MKELEIKTYNFSVQAIGLIKSLEKEFPELVNPELKKAMGNVSIKFMDAMDADENTDFANNLRDSKENAEKSHELLTKMGSIQNELFNSQRNTLISEAKEIKEKLENIISKLIY